MRSLLCTPRHRHRRELSSSTLVKVMHAWQRPAQPVSLGPFRRDVHMRSGAGQSATTTVPHFEAAQAFYVIGLLWVVEIRWGWRHMGACAAHAPPGCGAFLRTLGGAVGQHTPSSRPAFAQAAFAEALLCRAGGLSVPGVGGGAHAGRRPTLPMHLNNGAFLRPLRRWGRVSSARPLLGKGVALKATSSSESCVPSQRACCAVLRGGVRPGGK